MRRALPYLLLVAILPANVAGEVRLQGATVDGEPGDVVSLPVRLFADGGEEITGVAHRFAFDGAALALALSPGGEPDCEAAAELPVILSGFAGQPPPCERTADCLGVKSAVLFSAGYLPPPAGSELYRCRLRIVAGAPPGVYPLVHVEASFTTDRGAELPVTAAGGAVVVSRALIPTETATPPPTVTPSTPQPTPPVLGADCTGDCDGSETVDAAEEEALLRAIFDPRPLTACVGSAGAGEPRARAAHLLAAARARQAGCTDDTPTPTRTPSASPSARATASASPLPPSATSTRTPTTAPFGSPTRTPTRTRTPTPTRTSTPGGGPKVSFLGVARGDGRLVASSGEVGGVTVFDVGSGSGFNVVVEGVPAASLAPVGRGTSGGLEAPDLQMLVERDLGNGSSRVCSQGVPGFDAPAFDGRRAEVDAMNDLGCHFSAVTCVLFADGTRGFVAAGSTVQFCGVISSAIRFPRGATTVHVRLRDRDGAIGEVERIVVRVP